MKILINGIAIRGGGPETFLLGLLPHLVSQDRDDNYILIIPEHRQHLYKPLCAENVSLKVVPRMIFKSSTRRLWYEHVELNWFQKRERIDIHFRADELLSPLSIFLSIPSVVVFHATQHILAPKLMEDDSPLKLFYLNSIKRWAMRLATVPVTVSHHTCGELLGLYPFAQSRIKTIYHGINFNNFYPSQEVPSPLKDRGIDTYLLSVSDRHPHKNLARLVEAYGMLCQEMDVIQSLVLVGRAKSFEEELRIRKAIEKYQLGRKVQMLEYVEQDKLVYLYQGASLYLFPSVFETFGFTPLEAMACGIPVACARHSAMPEICGDAVEYFDPYDVEDIKEKIRLLLTCQERREDLIDLGFKHVKYFSWENAAKDYYRLLCYVAGRSL
jgi:glycosyltransferase involved in cell wall biosynthesis